MAVTIFSMIEIIWGYSDAYSICYIFSICVASIMQVTHMHNKNSNIQGSSGSKFLPLREVPILKRGTI